MATKNFSLQSAFFILLLIFFCLPACSAIAPRTTAALKGVVVTLCASSPEHRALRRASINAEMPAGHKIKLICPDEAGEKD